MIFEALLLSIVLPAKALTLSNTTCWPVCPVGPILPVGPVGPIGPGYGILAFNHFSGLQVLM